MNRLRWRNNDGRWVIVATGKRFTEPDGCKAVAQFRKLMSEKHFVVTGLLAEKIEWLQMPVADIVDGKLAAALSREFACLGSTGLERLDLPQCVADSLLKISC